MDCTVVDVLNVGSNSWYACIKKTMMQQLYNQSNEHVSLSMYALPGIQAGIRHGHGNPESASHPMSGCTDVVDFSEGSHNCILMPVDQICTQTTKKP